LKPLALRPAAGFRHQLQDPNREHRMTELAAIQALMAPLFPGRMGLRLLEPAPGSVLAEMPLRREPCTVVGMLHGGALMAFADTLGAVGAIVNRPGGRGTTTTDSRTKSTVGAKLGCTLRGECLALHRGRTTMVCEARITKADGRLCAVVRPTPLVLEPRVPPATEPA
jgi:uncharacterized protein (TIGR00369 family)